MILLRYINKVKGIIEKFEDSGLSDMTRTYSAFDKWIKAKTKLSKHNAKHKNKNNTKKHVRGMVYGGSKGRKNKTRKR